MTNDQHISQSIAEQYGAAFVMLENIIKNCKEELWQDFNKKTVVSQVVYHTKFYIDYYLSKDNIESKNFKGKLGDD